MFNEIDIQRDKADGSTGQNVRVPLSYGPQTQSLGTVVFEAHRIVELLHSVLYFHLLYLFEYQFH
jgi:hypothetical protein